MSNYKSLSNGVFIPVVGFGSYGLDEGAQVERAITSAIETGYRLIDTADAYKNEYGVGKAIRNCIERKIVSRNDLFITSKVPDWRTGYDSTLKCFSESLENLGGGKA